MSGKRGALLWSDLLGWILFITLAVVISYILYKRLVP